MKQQNILMGGVVVAILLIAVAMFGGSQTGSVVRTGVPGTSAPQVDTSRTCAVTSAQAISLLGYDLEQQQNAVGTSGVPSSYLRDEFGNPLSITSGVAPYVKFSLYAYNTSYYGSFNPALTSLCGATPVRALLAKRGGVAVTVYNKDGTANANATGNLSIANGQSVTIRFEPEENTTKSWFSNPEANYFEVGMRPQNASIWDLTESGINGEGVQQVSIGTKQSARGDLKVYRIPKAIGPFQTLYGYTLTLTALNGAAYEPVALDGAEFFLDFDDADYFITQMGDVKIGTEDDRGNDVGNAVLSKGIELS